MTHVDDTQHSIESAIQLVHEFWAVMDNVSDKLVETLFDKHGEFVIDPVTSPLTRVAGREELAAFGLRRRESARLTKRVTRHIVSNMRVVESDGSLITLSGHVTDYVGTGDLPLPLNGPTVVADFSYEVAFGANRSLSLMAVIGKVIFDAQH